MKSRARGAFFRDPIQTGALSVEQLGGDSKDGGREGGKSKPQRKANVPVARLQRRPQRLCREEGTIEGPAGGLTKNQIQKGVAWKVHQPGICRADVGRR